MADEVTLNCDRIWPVVDHNINPTHVQDLFNYSMPQELQYPTDSTRVPTIDSELDDDSETPYALPNYQLVRCSREKYPHVEQAQKFYNERRAVVKWRSEGAIYRTAKWWCKKVYA